MSTVAMNDFRNQPEALVKAEAAACERVIRSGWWILGDEVASFEKAWAQWLGVPHAIGCGNGLDAIEIALRCLGVGPGDEVITTPMTAFATYLAIVRSGATPVLADIDPQTAMLSPTSVERCIGPRTRAIILVHLYGQIGPVEQLQRLATGHGLQLIEDCAQAHGAWLGGRSAGSFGSIAAWSFYPTKNLGCIGDGGALTTASDELAEASRSLRNYGQSTRYYHPLLGMNSRLDEIQAAILSARLEYLTDWVRRRREIAHRYDVSIRSRAITLLPLPAEATRHAHHLFVVTTPQREELQQFLKQQQIESLIHYPVTIHQQQSAMNVARDPQGLRHAEAHARMCLSLPCHPGMSDADVDRVIAAVNRFGA